MVASPTPASRSLKESVPSTRSSGSPELNPRKKIRMLGPQIFRELRETPARHAFFPVISARLLIHFHSPGFRSSGSVSAPNWIRVSVSTRFPAAATIRFTW